MEGKRYKSRKSKYMYLLFVYVTVIFAAALYYAYSFLPDFYSIMLNLYVLTIILLLSTLSTNYIIQDEVLICQKSLLKKTIPISEIKRFTLGNHFWFLGRKFALSSKGIVVDSNDFKGILISPENQDEFIAEILKINSKIEIVNKD